VFVRNKSNPLITARDLAYKSNAVFNAGATHLGDKVVLMLRVESRSGRSHLTVAHSRNGISDWKIAKKPLMHADDGFRQETWGVEDCRITSLAGRNTHILTYTAYSPLGPAVGIAETKHFKTVQRLGIVYPPENKDAVLFPRKIKDEYVLLHRPATTDGRHIWIAYSPDLLYWGKPKMVLPARGNVFWDSYRVGAGPPPIETERGWLLIYHGVKKMESGLIYRIGAALLDLENPHRVIGRTNEYLMTPTEPYERIGDITNVLFATGGFVHKGDLWLYYGCADSYVCLATAPLSDIFDTLS